MIRIDRGTPSPELRSALSARLEKAVAARAARRDIVFDGHDDVKELLYEQQQGKCAYCERLAGFEGQPVEHFRPKAVAWRGDPWRGKKKIDRARYWWLAWRYSNLLFACVTCNCPNRKSNWFPLKPRTRPLVVPRSSTLPETHAAFQVDREHPLLVDPGADDPLEHIVWVPLDPSEPVDRMEWRPVHKTERGRYTIKILGLDRGVCDQVGLHIRHHVHPRIEGVARMAKRAARAHWAKVIRDLFADTQPFLAATHDAIDFFVPATVRQRIGLPLPRPGAPIQPPAP